MSKMAFRSLVSAVSEQCQEIRQTLSSISYFNTWDASAIAECCRLSSLAEFPPEEIILGSGTGNSHTVYFILDGVCRMIHYLQVEKKTESRGETKYRLYKPAGDTLNSDHGSVGYASLLFNEKHEFQRVKVVQDVGNNQKDARDDEQKGETEKNVAVPDKETQNTQSDSTHSNSEPAIQTEPESVTKNKELENSNEETKKGEKVYDENHHLTVLQECRKKLKDIIWVNTRKIIHERPKNVEGYFMQTAFLFKGACFGLRKCTDKNYIMSETKVKCLKIPIQFLLQHNPCNIWNRIILFDSIYLPKEDKILECFQTDRKWLEGKKKLTEDIISKKKIPIKTGISDVPYSIRLTSGR